MITIRRLHPSWMLPVSVPELRTALKAMLHSIGKTGNDYYVEMHLVDDAAIADLNESFLNCHGPTNILSFPATEDGNGPDLGWMALSIDTVNRECLLYGQDSVEHTYRLVAHGLLHLAGYDHGEAMFRLTDIAVNAAIAATR